MFNKSLTVVLPVYNGETRLRKSVNEILELASELTTKFGVESREELIDAWAAERSVGARLRGIAGLFAGFGLPKAGIAAALSGVTLAAAGAAVVVTGTGAQGQDSRPAPTPTPTAEDRRAHDAATNARLGNDPRAASQPVGPEVVIAWLNGSNPSSRV